VIHASYKGKLNSDNTINGTFTQGMPLPLNLKKGEASRPKRPQEPQPPFPYRSEEVTVRNERDGINLAGTLTLPEKGTKFPAVVMVTGSGAQNRDEEIMGHKPFFVIADYLTRNGIAVLRCDDRGTAASQGTHATATNEDFATDTEAMVNYLRSRKEINAKKIGIIGHSAGGIIAFIVAKKDLSIAFVVSLAGAGVRGDSLMLKQVELISKSQGMPDAVWQGMKPSIRNRYAILQQTDKTPEELQKELYADVTKTMSPEQLKDLNTIQQISAQISSMTSPWYLHFMRYDPGQDLKKLKCPVLALNGEKDIQVDAAMNLAAIQERITGNGNKNVTVKAYPNLNHLFQTCEKGTLAEYGQLEETINPEVLKDIIEWIRKQ
jgi:putative lipoprotein